MLIRQLPIAAVSRPPGWTYAPVSGSGPERRWVAIADRSVVNGRSLATGLYGWDNEFGERVVVVSPFETSACLVSNDELLEFWRAGGYDDPRLWSDEGWAWRRRVGQDHPRFWRIVDGVPHYRAMFDELELPRAWPAEVNAHEAWALCRWFGGGVRLPSEAEFLALTADAPVREGDVLGLDDYNLELRRGSPRAVDAPSRAAAQTGIHDPFGNVWQWLADDFEPLPGFEPHPLYPDFSAPYFDDEHAAMRGGSWASTGTSASRHYRLWFRRHFYQHAGFRLVRSVAN